MRHRSALYVHHLVDFHTWELPCTADLLGVVETSHRITHSLSKLSTFLANSTTSSFLISELASVASLFHLLMCDEALVSRWQALGVEPAHWWHATAWACRLLFFSAILALFIIGIDCGANGVQKKKSCLSCWCDISKLLLTLQTRTTWCTMFSLLSVLLSANSKCSALLLRISMASLIGYHLTYLTTARNAS